MIFVVLYVLFVVLFMASHWVIFTKAGEPGWAALVPIYNTIVLLKIVGKPWWWIFLLLIPCVGVIFVVIMVVDLAKSFDKDVGYGIGMLLLPFIFFPMLAFGDAEYYGPEGRRRGRSPRSMARYDDEDEEEDDRPRRGSRGKADEDEDDQPPSTTKR